MKFELFN